MVRFSSLGLQQSIIFILLGAFSLIAWGNLLYEHHLMNVNGMANSWMPPLSHEQWSLTDFAHTFFMWSVMMGAMMIPTVIPMALNFLSARRNLNFTRLPYAGAILFVAGYFLVWLVFCSLVTAAQWELHTYALLSPMMESRHTWLNITVLALAGCYQLTPWKAVCLNHCRSTTDLSHCCHMNSISVGFHHGLYCLGSCWALMLMAFAVGVMNLVWMGILTLFVLLEKMVPIKPIWLRSISGVGLLVWSGWMMIPLRLIEIVNQIILTQFA